MAPLEIAIIIILIVFVFLIALVYQLFFSPNSQFLGQVIFHSQNKEKLVALTFDDGPNEPYTSQILEILKKYNIKATFFPVGENILREKETLKKMAVAGHEIGVHSFYHAFLGPIVHPDFQKEITLSQNLITEIIGQKPVLFRPPWFFRTRRMLQTAKKLNLTTITGTFGSNFEVFKVSPQKIARDAILKTRPGTILVFHDGYNNKGTSRTQTVQAIAIIVPTLLKKGYQFVSVSDLLA